jgi:hypothetical protein
VIGFIVARWIGKLMDRWLERKAMTAFAPPRDGT